MERALLVTIKLNSEKDNWRMEDVAYEMEELAATRRAGSSGQHHLRLR